MVSISDALEDIIKDSPFIEEGLSRGIINFSAFAREVQPQIEKKLYKSIKTGAIIMALKRISERISKNNSAKNKVILTDLTVRSNLIEVTFLNSATLADKQRQLLNELVDQKEVFCTFSEGVRETTFIASASCGKLINRTFATESLVESIDSLSSITIRLPKEIVETPGVYYKILKRLAWENINIIEVISTYTEITIVFRTQDIDKAFSVLKKI